MAKQTLGMGKAHGKSSVSVDLAPKKRKIVLDQTLLALIISNILTMGFALAYNWNIIIVLWIYWSQSVIIGFVNVLRILSLKDFSTKGVKASWGPARATTAFKLQIAGFFAAHYGGFHLVYAFFLLIFTFTNKAGTAIGLQDFVYIGLLAAVFFATHFFSFQVNKGRDKDKQNIGRVMMFPYARIIPMHLTIIFGGVFLAGGQGSASVMLLFMALKTAADIAMHYLEHK